MITLGTDVEKARARARELLGTAPPVEAPPPETPRPPDEAPSPPVPAPAPPAPPAPPVGTPAPTSAARAALARLHKVDPIEGKQPIDEGIGARNNNALTPEMREKADRLARLAAKVLTNANTAAIGMSVRVFGHRVPALPDDDERELLTEAWQEYLGLVLGNRDMHPLIVVGLANAGIAFGMYRQGTPIVDELAERRLAAVPSTPAPADQGAR